jgi:predicted acylesterase/phospholipase RssA
MNYRMGLVLEGGGAKGAYAFGWLMEFAARGITFDAIAGTSVGTLNALLWASDQVEAGEQVWRAISEETTLAIRRPKWFWSIMVLPFAVHRWLSERISNLGDKVILSYTALAVSATTAVPILWLATEIPKQVVLRTAILAHPPSGFGEVFATSIVFIQWWLILCGGMFAIVATMAPEAAGKLVRFSWRSSTPLRCTIERILACKPLALPTFATVAEYREVSEPGRLRFFRGRAAPSGFWSGRDRYVPAYLPLHEMASDRVAALALASASLPYGITLPVQDGDHLFVDGGVIDNSPALPLIEREKCQLIVVIKLTQDAIPTTGRYADTFRRLKRLMVAAELTPSEASGMKTLTIDEPSAWPEFVTVMPSRPLGSLLSNSGDRVTRSSAIKEFQAMLRFDPEYVARLIALGRSDAAARPAAFWRRLSDHAA